MARDEELRKVLMLAFQSEAEEILRDLRSDLGKLESTSSDRDSIDILVRVHRNCHSLKGAAKVVDLTRIQIMSQALEDLFSKWKLNKVNPNEEIFNTITKALNVIEELVNAVYRGVTNQISDLVNNINRF